MEWYFSQWSSTICCVFFGKNCSLNVSKSSSSITLNTDSKINREGAKVLLLGSQFCYSLIYSFWMKTYLIIVTRGSSSFALVRVSGLNLILLIDRKWHSEEWDDGDRMIELSLSSSISWHWGQRGNPHLNNIHFIRWGQLVWRKLQLIQFGTVTRSHKDLIRWAELRLLSC